MYLKQCAKNVNDIPYLYLLVKIDFEAVSNNNMKI